MKKILLTCTDSMMMQFMVPHVRFLCENGYRVDVACSCVRDRMEEVREAFAQNESVQVFQVDLQRNPLKLSNFRGLSQLKKIIASKDYDLVWTNEPVMGLMTRLAARKARKKRGLKVMYMAHGFHFFKGAPKKNRLIYYPIERMASRWTDLLVVINQEDYETAKTKLKAKKVLYLQGIGIDTHKFEQTEVDKEAKKESLGIPRDATVLLSVGELEHRKNHLHSIRAFAQLNRENTYFLIAGTGSQKEMLLSEAKKLGVQEKVQLLGYRKDVGELCKMADVFVFLSRQEGLPVALMEAMICEMPVIASRVRGNVDELDDEKGGYLIPNDDVALLCEKMKILCEDEALRKTFGAYNAQKAKAFDIATIRESILNEITALIHGETKGESQAK